jgi:signal transduction histidine kinase
MKLLTKTTLYFITVSLFVFLFGGIAFYHLVKNSIQKNVDEQLQNRMHTLITEMRDNNIHPHTAFIIGEAVRFEKVDKAGKPLVNFSDTIIYNKHRKEYEPQRQFSFYIQSQNEIFKVFLHKSLTEANALIERLAVGLAALVIIFLFAILAINRFFFQKIWSEFFLTIKRIKNYEVSSKKDIDFPETEIIEFQQLNLVLEKMIQQIKQDYNDLKEFTENLTHEIQTPLAVVKTKIELLLQNPDLQQKDSELIHKIYSQIISLSKLNKSLILITRIENRHFENKEKVNLNKLIEHHLDNFEEIFEAKNLKLSFEKHNECFVETDKNLIDILLINLIKNAIKHNYKNGTLRIETSDKYFSIQNTGKAPDMPPENVFQRYSYHSKSDSSLGLGLTIVKKICDLYKFKINYRYKANVHTIRIDL